MVEKHTEKYLNALKKALKKTSGTKIELTIRDLVRMKKDKQILESGACKAILI